MKKAEYLHCSFAGSYNIECEILEEKDNMYKIKYYDFISKQDEEEWVSIDYLTFSDDYSI